MVINIRNISIKYDNILHKYIARTILKSSRYIYNNAIILKIQFDIRDIYTYSINFRTTTFKLSRFV